MGHKGLVSGQRSHRSEPARASSRELHTLECVLSSNAQYSPEAMIFFFRCIPPSKARTHLCAHREQCPLNREPGSLIAYRQLFIVLPRLAQTQ